MRTGLFLHAPNRSKEKKVRRTVLNSRICLISRKIYVELQSEIVFERLPETVELLWDIV